MIDVASVRMLGWSRDDADPARQARRFGPTLVARLVVAAARALAGASVRWIGSAPAPRQRVYFANHTSHLDVPVLWAALPADVRAVTRPVAARDYWSRGALRRYLAERVFNAVLIERHNLDAIGRERQIDAIAAALSDRHSVIIFPEGTRGASAEPGRFKSGLYHLARRRPDVELVPVYLENLDRILPKGAVLPVPQPSRVRFGRPIRLAEAESKDAFLARAREAVLELKRAA